LQTQLQTDASEHGIGESSMSKQMHLSMALVKVQCNGHMGELRTSFEHERLDKAATEKECLGIVAALKHFTPYLLGRYRQFAIQTDHQTLDCMKNNNG
jgi:hypothetical protein